jgi:serine/threonine protein kinase/outer membrane protein assembly factor BamD (BamD/ComL family)
MDKEIGRSILGGKYRITAEIGRGGMGVVYKGIQSSLGRSVAIKVLPAQIAQDRAFLNRFRREAEALGRLNHPNIVTIHDLDMEGDDHFLVMECVDGHDLSAVLQPGRPVPIYLAVSIAIQTADALDAAHRCGIVHRDVKPQNILIEEITGRVKVADFGVAAMTDTTSLTRTGSVIGTPKYMSPEQIQGLPVTGATDIYALGVVLYEMLAGRAPFLGDTAMAIAYQHVDGALPPLAGLAPEAPPALVKIVERALQKQPERRFASAGEMATALRAVPIKESTALGGRAEGMKGRRVARRAALAGALAIAATATLLVGQMLRTRSDSTSAPKTPRISTQQGDATQESAVPPESPVATLSPPITKRAGADESLPTPGSPLSGTSKNQPADIGREGQSAGRTTPASRDAGAAPTESKVPSGQPVSEAASKVVSAQDAAPKDQVALSPAPAVPSDAGASQTGQPAGEPAQGQIQPPHAERVIYDNAQLAFRSANYSAALAGYRSYLQKNPDPELAADAQHGLAESLYNLGNYASAILEYQKVVDGFPTSKWADDSSYAIAWCYEKQRNYADATRSYLSFVAKYPDSVLAMEAQYRAARCHFDQADYSSALPAYQEVVRNYPRSAFADLSQYAIGECYYRQGDYVNAASEYAKVILNYPGSQWADDAQISVGWSFFKQKDYARALSEFSIVERTYPQSDQIPAALVQAARCHLALGDRSAAEKGLREVIQRFPGSKAAGEAQETLATLR